MYLLHVGGFIYVSYPFLKSTVLLLHSVAEKTETLEGQAISQRLNNEERSYDSIRYLA